MDRQRSSQNKVGDLDKHAAETEKYLSMKIPKTTVCKLVDRSRPTLDTRLERRREKEKLDGEA